MFQTGQTPILSPVDGFPGMIFRILTAFLLLTVVSALAAAGNAVMSLSSEERQWLEVHKGKINLAFDPNFPPLEYVDNEGNYRGFSADLIRALEKKIGFRFNRSIYTSWKDVLDGARRGEVDVITMLSETAERRGYLVFTRPYISIPFVIVSTSKLKGNADFETLKGKKVGVVHSYTIHEILLREHTAIDIVPVDNERSGLLKLSAGELDAMVMYVSTASYFIRNLGLTDMRISDVVKYRYGFCIGVSNKYPILRDILQKALDETGKEEIDTYYDRWVKISTIFFYESPRFWRTAGVVLGAIVVFLLLIAYYNRTLKDQVTKKTNEYIMARNNLITVFNSIQSALFIVSNSGAITQMNVSAVELLENTGNIDSAGGLFWEAVPELKVYRSDFDEVVRTLKPRNIHRIDIGQNEKRYTVNVFFIPVSFEEDSGAIIRIDDISELEKKEKLLRDAQKMEIIGTLAGGIAHDFNNILGGIIGFVSIMKIKLEKGESIPEERLKKYLTMLDESGHRAAELVQQLLLLGKKRDLDAVPIDLNRKLEYIVDVCRNSFDKSIVIKPGFYDSPVMISGDPGQIEQALLNIFINASHAMTIMRAEDEKQGGELGFYFDRYTADGYEFHHDLSPGDYWVLSIYDSGVGMTGSDAARIFDPFFSTKPKGQGTGLGLTMVYNIITGHGGFVNVYSERGMGTTFKIYLPVLESADSNSVEVSVSKEVPTGEGCILVVDDEQVIREIAGSILTECGYDVVTAENGFEALNIFRERAAEIKLVLLDMAMPGMSGLEVFVELQKMDPEVRVLLSSGFRMDERVQKAIGLGVKGFVQKPYNFRKLAEEVASVISMV